MPKTGQLIRTPYKNLSGKSGVRFYARGASFIDVWFANDRGYRYDETLPGAAHVQTMKRLAEQGEGLTTYINQHIRKNYARPL